MSKIRVLNAAEVRQALPMAQAIEGTKEAYVQLSGGKSDVPLRSRIDIPERQGISLFMPAYLSTSADLAIKIVSIFPTNVQQGMPVINAAVLVLDADTGQPVSIMEGSSLTAIRTGAASGAATEILARTDSQIGAVFGSGVQARTQLEAICTVRTLTEIRIFSLDIRQAQQVADDLAGKGPIPSNIRVVHSPGEAVIDADIICTATTSHKPVFDGADLEPGTHINAIGSFTPDMQEIDSITIKRSSVFVDSLDAALEEAGDLIIPIEAGMIDPSHIKAELGQVISGERTGRSSNNEITFFKSVGIAVQDAVAGRITQNNALKYDLGTVVQF